jgi:ABC-type uncharacterized transport system permease subunit
VEDFVDELTRGNVSQVKTVLASVVMALALYQVALMAVGYGKVRVPFLTPKAASMTHRAVGDAAVAVAIFVVAVVAKVAVVRWLRRFDRLLPTLGLTMFTLFAIAWLTSAGNYLWS